jgi:transcriptional repressor NrdR
MVCINCGSETKVTNSRPQKRNNQIWRRRECQRCHTVFTTEEIVRLPLSWRVKTSSGGLEPFSRDKLFVSLHKSLQHRKTALEDADGLADTVIRKLTDIKQSRAIDKQQIIQLVQVTLTRFDKAAAVHYQAHHG